MTIKELITQLQKFPDTAEVEIFHDEYCGGGDSERFDAPAVFVDSNLTVVYLTAIYYGNYLRGTLPHDDTLLSMAEFDELMGAK